VSMEISGLPPIKNPVTGAGLFVVVRNALLLQRHSRKKGLIWLMEISGRPF